MARYIDADKFMIELNNAQIEFDEYYNGLGRAKGLLFLQPACDVVPRSEYEVVVSAVDNSTKEFLKLHDAYQSQKRKLDEYKKFIGEIRVTGENHAVIIESEHTEYLDKRVAEGFKNMAVKQAKQEVTREIFEEIEKKLAEEDNIFEKCASRLVGSDYCNGRSETIGFILNLIAELKKKYTGE